jgi:HK97 gp10 family phage protein
MVTFDASELNKLAVDLGHASAKIVKPASLAIRKTAYDIERDAKAFCPVDTGNLRNSISTDARGLSAEIGPTAEYAAYVEEGTSRMAPQAYMGPAYDRHAGELVVALEHIAGDIL